MGVRHDSVGMFWEDIPADRKRGMVTRPMPEIPETGWRPPSVLPNLRAAKVISIDTETWDPELEDHGPGWARGVGHLVGISVGVETGERWYFPMRHETNPEENMDPKKVLAWAKENLCNPNQPKVGANLGYDVGWLKQEGVNVQGELFDVQFAEALLDERARVSLETLAQKYLGVGKESNRMYRWLADWQGGNPNGKQRKWIFKTPPSLCGPYAESDADLPLRLMTILYPMLDAEGLLPVFKMENKLIYLLTEMRFAGVSVDVVKAEELSETLGKRIIAEQAKLEHMVGGKLDIGKKGQLAKVFDHLGIPYNMTSPTKAFPKGQASFTKDYLAALDHPIGAQIREIRKCEHLKGTFVDSYILNAHINGKVYCQFHPMRGDSGGTRSGRFSSSDPNLQNIPSRDDELAPLIRGLFIPDAGHPYWRKYDYSQIEYRCLIHDAVGPSAEMIRQKFRDNPNIDYHDLTQSLIKEMTGIFLERKPIKTINFGLIYGMGIPTLCKDLGITRKDGKGLFKAYHKGAPWAGDTMAFYSEIAAKTGEVSTILGRKSRFDLWEPTTWSSDSIALPLEDAILNYNSVRRAYTHKALNRRLQGSAADLMKASMVQAWEDGVFDATGVPRLTVHDELDFSDPGGKDEAFLEMKHIMETAIEFRIPIKADYEIGPDWGHVVAE